MKAYAAFKLRSLNEEVGELRKDCIRLRAQLEGPEPPFDRVIGEWTVDQLISRYQAMRAERDELQEQLSQIIDRQMENQTLQTERANQRDALLGLLTAESTGGPVSDICCPACESTAQPQQVGGKNVCTVCGAKWWEEESGLCYEPNFKFVPDPPKGEVR